ncbi:hypothetical protein N7486_009252 [Penicillium sp. IBT 16267x]|nr:hypothetical protein N7486_009252 [Penicillium sp. IBT 16267x]
MLSTFTGRLRVLGRRRDRQAGADMVLATAVGSYWPKVFPHCLRLGGQIISSVVLDATAADELIEGAVGRASTGARRAWISPRKF